MAQSIPANKSFSHNYAPKVALQHEAPQNQPDSPTVLIIITSDAPQPERIGSGSLQRITPETLLTECINPQSCSWRQHRPKTELGSMVRMFVSCYEDAKFEARLASVNLTIDIRPSTTLYFSQLSLFPPVISLFAALVYSACIRAISIDLWRPSPSLDLQLKAALILFIDNSRLIRLVLALELSPPINAYHARLEARTAYKDLTNALPTCFELKNYPYIQPAPAPSTGEPSIHISVHSHRHNPTHHTNIKETKKKPRS
ncbi:uncharacterized protein BDR25DRAFT_349620 [Lindgomyces ingoldianus]|uniref:Uncharacterized protein n=1 Tax=Lindgomyces ingoldianus TaxID=673940 RepID=A0ACB6RDI6_9PLEO|nr:uncharacterized protein BDR25DRAFT_349620 [Lindgomyces ingoldianus]KAF2476541.1 hypothetical protein BDR25DRAFT_349620 [Lindgomyces ingoldianus]